VATAVAFISPSERGRRISCAKMGGEQRPQMISLWGIEESREREL
jgi:hypothetical protein